MPDKRAHRGPHPEDGESFAPKTWPQLRQAVADLSWLLSRNYAEKSALKLVGDHYQLTLRQRMGVMRCSCSDFALARRRDHELSRNDIKHRPLMIDGYNVLTTVEAALANGIIIQGRDGCYRDMASMHGSFRKVSETMPAIIILGEMLTELETGPCTWYLDSPVSNSGRLKTTIRTIAADNGWDWQVEVVQNPDAVLIQASQIVVTADSVILNRCEQWYNLARETVTARLPDAYIVNLAPCR